MDDMSPSELIESGYIHTFNTLEDQGHTSTTCDKDPQHCDVANICAWCRVEELEAQLEKLRGVDLGIV